MDYEIKKTKHGSDYKSRDLENIFLIGVSHVNLVLAYHFCTFKIDGVTEKYVVSKC